MPDAPPPTVAPLRLVLFSNSFLPTVGGLEQVGLSLASGWAAAGHSVTVVTATAADAGHDRSFPFGVVRLPSRPAERRAAWREVLGQVDLLICSGLSLRHWPAWVRSRVPIVYLHHLYLGMEPWTLPGPPHVQLQRAARLVVRRWVLRRAAGNVYISRFIRDQVRVPGGVVIYNPVDTAFGPMDVPRVGDVAFFGRMVDEKGVDHLLEAIALCGARGHRFTIDLYGEGRDLDRFQRTADRLGLGGGQVRWHGFVRGEPLVAAMNGAGVVVVPSTWREPMGIVAVEAMACGRCVIGSAGGGLGEVLEGFCPTFPNGDTAALADQLIGVLTDDATRSGYERAALARSQDFRLDRVARAYIDYFRAVLG